MWTKLDDNFWMHPKIVRSGNAATGVFARLLSYCGCYSTDGLVPRDVATFIAGTDAHTLELLEENGLVVVRDTGSLYIPDFLEHNFSKAEVEARKAKRSESGRRGAAAANGRKAAS